MIFICGKDGVGKGVSPEDLHTIEDFGRMLAGGSGCMFCLMPTSECTALGEEKCCPDCRHGRIKTKEERA